MKKCKLFIFVLLMVIIVSGCDKNEVSLSVIEIADEKEIEKAMEHIDNSMGLMGYMPLKVYKADLNADGTYETYASSEAGSGIVHAFVECYERVTKTYSSISERMKTDYYFYNYKDNLYIISVMNMLSSFYQPPHAYKVILVDNELSYEEIDEELEKDILESYNDEGAE